MKRCLAIALALCGCVDDPGPQIDLCPPLEKVDPMTMKADPNSFVSVSPVLEKRCGTLDCHGNIARPLRIYGATGLRYVNVFDHSPPPSQAPGCRNVDFELADPHCAEINGVFPGTGGNATTDDERAQNWHAVCGLQPEMMTQVTTGQLDPDKLLLLTKPLGYPAGKQDDDGGERHKGGKVLKKGDDGYCCIWSWLVSAAPAELVPPTNCAIDKPGDVDLQSCNQAIANL